MTGTPLVGIVTTDLAAITRGRFVAADRLETTAATGVGWVPANLSLGAFGAIADPNPWGSTGDLRLIPDLAARFRTEATGTATPFDMVMADMVELDGSPAPGCTRTLLRDALADFQAATGLSLIAAFEHEFQLFGTDLPPAHPFAFAGLRRADPFAPRLMAALSEAGLEPDVIIAEYGRDQFEVTTGPVDGLAAADRAVALREITRELAGNLGWRACFAPKTAPDAVGNGVHIHFSFRDADGRPAMYDTRGPGGLSGVSGSFCAGVLRHLPALVALTAPSVPSYYRMVPHSWSASYTSLGERDREASLRICPTVAIGGRDPAKGFNVEYRAADAIANPYLALAVIVRAGLAGIAETLPPPPIVSGDASAMSDGERAALGLVRLPETLEAALVALEADPVARGWLPPLLLESYVGVRRLEMATLAGLDRAAVCAAVSALY
jgi:glutamine synthetase